MVRLQGLDLEPSSRFLVEARQGLPVQRHRLSRVLAPPQHQSIHSGNYKMPSQSVSTDFDSSVSDWSSMSPT